MMRSRARAPSRRHSESVRGNPRAQLRLGQPGADCAVMARRRARVIRVPWMLVARAQWETGYLTTAMQSYRRFLDLGGRNATNLATFGRLCLAAHEYDEASRAFDEAAQLDPNDSHLLSAQATLAMFRGRFRRCARIRSQGDPGRSTGHVGVQGAGPSHRRRIGDDEQAQLRRLSEDSGLRLQDRISASFALGDCLDAQGDIDQAFAAYERANRLSVERARQEGVGYDRNERARQVDWLMSRFRAVPAAALASAATTPRPCRYSSSACPDRERRSSKASSAPTRRSFACGERQEMRSIMQEFVSPAFASGIPDVPESTKQRWREAFWRELPDLARSHRNHRQEPVELRRAGPHPRALSGRPHRSCPARSGGNRPFDLSQRVSEIRVVRESARGHRPLLRRIREAHRALGGRSSGALPDDPVRGSRPGFRRRRARAPAVLRSRVGGGVRKFPRGRSDHRNDHRRPGPPASCGVHRASRALCPLRRAAGIRASRSARRSEIRRARRAPSS